MRRAFVVGSLVFSLCLACSADSIDTTSPRPLAAATVTMVRLEVSPDTARIALNGTQVFTIRGTYSDGTTNTDPTYYAWTTPGGWFSNGTYSSKGVAGTYKVAASKVGGLADTSIVIIGTVAPAPAATLMASPTSILSGSTSTLTWSSSNVTSCTASGAWSAAIGLSGTQSVSPTATSMYTITCTGGGSTATQSAIVTVTATPSAPTATITATPASIAKGSTSTLTWSSTNATSCAATGGWTDTIGLNGTQAVSPTATSTYTITCTDAGGTATQSATITVTDPPPTVTLTANPTSILTGGSSTLTWTSTGATGCSATGGWTDPIGVSGTLAVTPPATSTYTISCTGTGGTATHSVTVTVTPPPAPIASLTANPLSIVSGTSSTLSWSSTNATGCSATGAWADPIGLSGTLVVSPASTSSYALTCSGAGGTAIQSVTITVTAPPPPPPPPPTGAYSYPLRIGPTGRYLVDQVGAPFLLVGDAAWSLFAQLSDADAETYFSARAAQGFTVSMANLIEHRFSKSPPANVYGQKPFTGTNFTTPNDAYFAHVDAAINAAAAHGIAVMVDVLYLGSGCGSEGWAAEVKAASAADMQTYGGYVGRRYASFPNIIWQIGGDVDPAQCGVTAKLQAMVNGILGADRNHPFTAHNNAGETSADVWGSTSWLTLNGVYTYDNQINAAIAGAVAKTPVRPVFFHEGKYENETEWNVTQVQLRTQIYWTLLSGGVGNVYGNCPVWNFDSPSHGGYCPQIGWLAQLSSQGAMNMKYGQHLFRTRNWWLLVPDATHTVTTAGYGTGASLTTTAYASDGSSIIAYMPSSRTITVSTMRLVGATALGYWYQPSSGAVTPLGSFAIGSRTFTPPGSGDWVLLLDSQAASFPAP